MRLLIRLFRAIAQGRSPSRRNGFRPVNTLSSPKKPTFESSERLSLGIECDYEIGGWKMVRERSPNKTSTTSPQKAERLPLANISTTMQSPSPKQPKDGDGEDLVVKPSVQPEFGKASPLRNPLVKKQEPSIFIPRKPPPKKTSPQNPMHARQPTYQSADARDQQGDRPKFYLPGQRAPAPAPQYSSALAAAQAFASQPFQRSFDPDYGHAPRPTPIPIPTNAPLPSIYNRPQQTYSIGPKTHFQPFVPPRQTVDLTKDDDDEDSFNPDAIIRAESGSFGQPDPYMYVDSSQANENIKNLLEGAFDDDNDASKTRLRKRAKKALNEGKEKEAKGLAGKLQALSVEDQEKKKAAEKEQEEEDEDEEDGTVEGLAVKLLPHQVEGVAWMINKEIGKVKRNKILPKGGILADDMGLGKTVQSITLILTNARPAPDAKPEHKDQKLPGKEVEKGTLVVAPLALIKQWESEIKTKVSKSHALRVLVHHGPARTKSAFDLKKYDVVITTYQTLVSEHAGSDLENKNGARIGCFGVHWYRLILDEAHSIKNKSAKSAQAACALNSWFRWCLTGTPMQNNLDELQSLIKFLQIKPYCDMREWKDGITGPIKNGRGGMGIRRLQVFMQAIMKRRTKDILKKEGALNFGGKVAKEGEIDADGEPKKQEGMQIVKREVVTVECEFDDQELKFYNNLQRRADDKMKQIEARGKNDYIGALVLLLRLRQACNHPQLIEMAMNKDKDAMTTGTNGNGGFGKGVVEDNEMDALADLMGGVSVKTKHCDVCQFELSAAESANGAVRCGECDADLADIKRGKKKLTIKKEGRKRVDRKPRTRRRIDDSDEEGQGEWIAKEPERRIDFGKAGGSDDEDAEGGGETLASIDSDRSAEDDEDEEDSPPRARRRKYIVEESDSEDEASKAGAEDSNIKDESASEDIDDSSSDSDSDTPIIRGLAPSGTHHTTPSTKIRHLLRILHAESPTHKTIVFSQFTSMLDLIEPHLRRSNLRFVRYDGSMRPDAREASLQALRADKKTRILLCSLKCGSLGLNLTAASRVVIVEPFWNPFVEEQAIDRVHRLNQTVDVKVYRLTIRATVEERIIELQERKRELAAAAIEGSKGGVGKLTMEDIMKLFGRDAERATKGQYDKEDWAISAKFGSDTRLLDGGFEQAGTLMEKDRRLGKGPAARGKAREHDVYGRRW